MARQAFRMQLDVIYPQNLFKLCNCRSANERRVRLRGGVTSLSLPLPSMIGHNRSAARLPILPV